MEKLLNLEYRGEGNRSIVFACPQTNQVFRVVKHRAVVCFKNQQRDSLTGTNNRDLMNAQTAVKEIQVLSYMNNIIRPLLSDHYIIMPTITSIARGFGQKAMAVVDQARPAHRKVSKNDTVDSDNQFALVMPDCCFVHYHGTGGSSQNVDSSSGDMDESFDSTSHSDSDIADNLDLKRGNILGSSAGQDSSGDNGSGHVTLTPCVDGSLPHICPPSDRTCGTKPHSDCIYFNQDGLYPEKDKMSNVLHKTEHLKEQSNFTISFEIKPKKAFITWNSTDPSSQNNQVCRFCMHQHLKIKSGQWPQTSSYCPLDLFSGNKHRMRHALFSLMKTPQNNLKICKNGKEVYGLEIRKDLTSVLRDWFPFSAKRRHKLKSVLVDLVIEILLDTGGCDLGEDNRLTAAIDPQSVIRECENSSFVHHNETTSRMLPQGCVLERIVSIQAVDELDIDGVLPLYQKVKDSLEQDPTLGDKWCISGPYDGLTWLFGHPGKQLEDLDPDSVDYAALQIKRFLVSKTLQDCSIIVAIKPILNSIRDKRNVIRFEGDLYEFSVSVVDLDPKSVDKISTYYLQAKDMESAYAETANRIPTSHKAGNQPL